MFKLERCFNSSELSGVLFPGSLLDIALPSISFSYGASAVCNSKMSDVPGFLSQVIDLNQVYCLGAELAEKYGNLPFVASFHHVEKPLPLMINPSKERIELGYEMEEQLCIKRNDMERCYPDTEEKTQIYTCLSECKVFYGFKEPRQVYDFFRSCGLRRMKDMLSEFESSINHGGLVKFYKSLSQLSKPEVKYLVRELFDRQRFLETRYREEYAYARYLSQSKSSPYVVLGAFILKAVELRPSMSLYVPVGIPYQLLSGSFLEVSAPTRNALTFHDECSGSNVTESFAAVGNVVASAECEVSVYDDYLTYQHEDFLCQSGLYRVDCNGREFNSSSPELVGVVSGRLRLSSGGREVDLIAGECAFILHGFSHFSVEGSGLLFRVGLKSV
ncbi:hypothetical protein F7U66_00280 [Vibrio parahaemolyticus]|nr:hypothetical protein [Vibrio parahaemolyticus]